MQLISYILHSCYVLMVKKITKNCRQYKIFPFYIIKYATCIKEVIM